MTIQAKVKPGARPDPGSVWASPQRDLAHSFPEYVRKALVLSQAEYSAEDEEGVAHLTDLARTISEFISGAVGEGSCETVGELARKVELLKLNEAARNIFCCNLFHVIISAYWKGVRMAYAKDETPIGADELAVTVDELTATAPTGRAYVMAEGSEVLHVSDDSPWHQLRIVVEHIGMIAGGDQIRQPHVSSLGVSVIATDREAFKALLCERADNIFDAIDAEQSDATNG